MPRKTSQRKKPTSRPALHVAIVHTVDRVCFVTTARSRPDLRAQLARYVREHAAHQLAPAAEQRVRTLIEAGDVDAGIEHYFANTGSRWDEQWLVTAAVDGGAMPGALARLGLTGAATDAYSTDLEAPPHAIAIA